MKYLKTYESSSEFSIEFAMSKINEEFPEDRVVQMYDDEWQNWIDDTWEDEGYDSDYDWYVEHNNGEAQDVVYEEIISWFCHKYDKVLLDKDRSSLYNKLKDEYNL